MCAAMTRPYWSKTLTRRTEYTVAFLICVWFISTSAVMIKAIEADAKQSAATVPLTPRSQFGTYVPSCGHLYNVGKHKEWTKGIGVGYSTQTTARQMKRDDI